jgi:hypothetical protein
MLHNPSVKNIGFFSSPGLPWLWKSLISADYLNSIARVAIRRDIAPSQHN